MLTDAKTNAARLGNGALRLFTSAGNVEYTVFCGSKRIMQRCNTYGQKLRNCLQRCKCSVAAVRKDHVAVGKICTAARRLHVGQVLDKLRTKGRTFVSTSVQHMSYLLS